MPMRPVSTDGDNLYVRDRIAAATPFDAVQFARRFEHRRARVDGVSIHFVIGGEGPPLLLGHGWPASWYEWRKVMPLLADRFTCIAFDMPGIGDSSPPPAFDKVTIGRLIAKFVREHLDLRSVFVVGHDISGPPLASMAAYEPGLVNRMLLTETSLLDDEMGPILLRHINEIWHFPINAARLSPSFMSGREEQFIPQFFTEWVYNVGAIGPEDIAEYVRTARRPGALECGASYYNAAPTPAEGGGELPEGSLSMPLLYIGAELGFGGWLGGDDRLEQDHSERNRDSPTSSSLIHLLQRHGGAGWAERTRLICAIVWWLVCAMVRLCGRWRPPSESACRAW